MSQLSFFSAESVPPAVADLTGVLAAAGQVVIVGGGARLSVVVDERVAGRGAGRDDRPTPGCRPRSPAPRRTPRWCARPSTSGWCLSPRDWTRGAVKTVPPQWLPGPRELRAWTLAAGIPEADRYLLGLDPHAPDTHSPLASALMRVGIAPTLIGTRGSRPALRISGRRRLSRLVENVGEPPAGREALSAWPTDLSRLRDRGVGLRRPVRGCEIVSARADSAGRVTGSGQDRSGA